MICLQIISTRSGRLWPAEHWKCLIDALFAKGSKDDPRPKYQDLQDLNDFVQHRDSRFFPVDDLMTSKCDDSELRMILVQRGTAQSGRVSIFDTRVLPETESWFVAEVPWLGTIGDRRAELQTKDNQNTLQRMWPPDWPESDHLSVEFSLSSKRPDRDLDNLADGLMPFFSARFPALQALRLFKSTHSGSESESVRISSELFTTNVCQVTGKIWPPR